MKVLVQWTQATPGDWTEVDAAGWAALPDRGVPPDGALGGGDDEPGWVHRVNVQGVTFIGDHYAVEDLGQGGCRVTAWFDDLDSYPPDEWLAIEVTFLPPAPDPRLGGAVNTRQRHVVYAAPASPWWGLAGQAEADVRPWAAFIPPPAALTRHGIWVADALNAAHEARQSPRGVRDWVPDLGRRADGTRVPLGPHLPARDPGSGR